MKTAAEQIRINEDYLNGYIDGEAAAGKTIASLRERLDKAMNEHEELRKKYEELHRKHDIGCLRAGDVVETSEGYIAVLVSEDTDESWNMVYENHASDNMTKRCFRKTGKYIDLEGTAFAEVYRLLKSWEEIDTDW